MESRLQFRHLNFPLSTMQSPSLRAASLNSLPQQQFVGVNRQLIPKIPFLQSGGQEHEDDQSKPKDSCKAKILRRGKWTACEEKYADKIIEAFKSGVLGSEVREGTTLRSLLASRLKCAPMRISKKYSGSSIGKVGKSFFGHTTFLKYLNVSLLYR
jgi:hypothetical protein